MYTPFTYYTPPKVVFGPETEKQAGALVKEFGGTKVLVHYGSQSAVKSGLLKAVTDSLDAEGIAHVELGGVVPNPHLGKVYEGIDIIRKTAETRTENKRNFRFKVRLTSDIFQSSFKPIKHLYHLGYYYLTL